MHLAVRRYTQEPHCAIERDIDPFLEVKLVDGGGGEYIVINACEWAIDCESEIDDLAVQLRWALDFCRPTPDVRCAEDGK